LPSGSRFGRKAPAMSQTPGVTCCGAATTMSFSVWVEAHAVRGTRLSAASAQLNNVQPRILRTRKSRRPGFDGDFEWTAWLIFSPGDIEHSRATNQMVSETLSGSTFG